MLLRAPCAEELSKLNSSGTVLCILDAFGTAWQSGVSYTRTPSVRSTVL